MPLPCSLCNRAPPFRRTLCRSCYRKLRACGCPLPPRGRPYQSRRLFRRGIPTPDLLGARLVRWLARWPPEARRKLADALSVVSAP